MEEHLSAIYQNRFKEDFDKRETTWRVLTKYFFSKYVKTSDSVLEIASGYGHFINNIEAKKKIALDLNPNSREFLNSEVQFLQESSSQTWSISENSIDIVFVSNFFEHIDKNQILQTLKQANRVLKKGGLLIILQPNIRYLANDYWMFFDHITPLDDRSLSEALVISSFKVEEIYPKFLPFSIQGRLPVIPLLIRLYLLIPLAWKILGKQALLIGRK